MAERGAGAAVSRDRQVAVRAVRFTPLRRVVAMVAGAGVVAITSLLILAPARQASAGMYSIPGLSGTGLLIVLTVLTCVSELVAVPLRRDDALEELTLLDAVVLLNVFLLPPADAVITSLGGLLIAYLLRRREPIKVSFNLGTYSCAASAAIAACHLIVVNPDRFDARLAMALVAAAVCFVAVNTVAMALLLSTMGAGSFTGLVRDDLGLSALTVAGTVGLTGTALALGAHAPVLLPCAILPAVALWYSYTASAGKHEERRRSARVLAFSQVLAASPDRGAAVRAFLQLARDEFAADGALAFTGAEVHTLLAGQDSPEVRVPVDDSEAIVTSMSQGELVHGPLPHCWAVAMKVPLVADGRQLGCIVVGSKRRNGLRSRDLTSAIPLAGALAGALLNADQAEVLAAETSKLRAVVEQSGEGIVVLDGAGTVLLWSPAMEAMTGLPSAATVGSPLGLVLRCHDDEGADRDAFRTALSAVTTASTQVTVELHTARRDGDERAIRMSHAFLFDGPRPIRDVVIVSDLTAQRRTERMKTDFVATVSHELRTPLTPIRGYAELLRKRGDDLPAAKRQRALDLIIDRSHHLGLLIDDLLLASSISSGGGQQHTLDVTAQDLSQLARRAIEDFPRAGARVEFVADAEPVVVSSDATRTIQILTNLISNAVKYSPSSTPVTITVAVRGHEGEVTVADEGLGIPHDQLGQIFDKFHRVEDPHVMSTSGTGLGLFIARHLAHAMGGDLTVESALGRGSRFTLRLPLTQGQGRVI